MKKRTVVSGLALGMALGILFMPIHSHAQQHDVGEGDPGALCYWIDTMCFTLGMERGDKMPSDPSPFGWTPEPTYHHTDCLVCAPEDGDDGICHYSCEDPEEQEEEVQLAHFEAYRAFVREDVSEIAAQSARLGSYLYWNEARGLLQLRSCTQDAVVASLRLGDADREMIAWARQHLTNTEPKTEGSPSPAPDKLDRK